MKRTVLFDIPEPCHEDWQQMTPHEQGRFCGSCQKTVTDFTMMSDQEVLRYISKASSMVCGRFNDDQLNRPFIEQTAKPSFSFRYVWSMLVSGFLLVTQGAAAQTKKPTGKPLVVAGNPVQRGEVVVKPPAGMAVVNTDVAGHSPAPINIRLGGTRTITQKDLKRISKAQLSKALAGRADNKPPAPLKGIGGVVKDDKTQQPIAFASISIKDVGTVAAADQDGRFEIAGLAVVDSVVLEVSAVGYDGQEYTLHAGEALPAAFTLSPTSAQLKEVVVQSYGSRKLTGMVGGARYCVKVTRLEQVQRTLSDLLPGKKEVTVFPNPATPGGPVRIAMNFKNTGDHKLELLDAGGRVVHVQALQVVQSPQVLMMPTQSSWSRGIYWLRITGGEGNKVYQAKLVLQ